MKCARCQKEWAGDPVFVTCPECRVTPVARKKQGCTRFSRVGSSRKREPDTSPWGENNVRHMEDR